MDESTVALCANDGVVFVLKVSKDKEQMPAFYCAGDDHLMTKEIGSRLTVENSIKCQFIQLGESSMSVVFAPRDERQKVSNMITKIAKSFHQQYNRPIALKTLHEEIANTLNQMSVHGTESKAEVLFAGWNSVDGAELYAINSDKSNFKCFSYAIGGNQEYHKSCLNCILSPEMTTVECMTEGIKMLIDHSEENFEYQLMRIGVASEGKCEKCCEELHKEVLLKAFQK